MAQDSLSSPASAPGAVVLLCPVRRCGRALEPAQGGLACAAGHRFDRARSGYVNLLQPQERRSATPGDAAASAKARRRLWEAGHEAPLLEAIVEEIGALGHPVATLLDVGCGEGSLVAALAERCAAGATVEAHGVDISTPSIELAARAHRAVRFVIANADRRLPYAGGSFDVALCVNAHGSLAEIRRVLRAGGYAILVVPGAGDLAEVREALAGEATLKARAERRLAVLPPGLEFRRLRAVAWRAALAPALLEDLLLATYRGARHRQQQRLAERPPAEVTRSHDVVTLHACGGEAPASPPSPARG